jgi:succinoglycan biosynthesis transport protein ExoP
VTVAGILTVAKRWWALLLLGGILAGSGGYVMASQGPRIFESRVRLLVGPLSTGIDVLRANDLLSRTYAELVTSDALLQATIDELDLDRTPDELREVVHATADGPTRLLIVRVQDEDPEQSAAVADAIAGQLGRIIERSQRIAVVPTNTTIPTEASAPAETAGLLVLDAARPGELVATRSGIITVISALTGMAAAFALALVVTALRETIGDEEEVGIITGVETLGLVRSGGGGGARSLAVRSRPDSPRAIDCRVLATKLELLCRQESLKSLLILGAADGGETGDLAANLASALAERRTHVALVDADHVTRGATRVLGFEDRPGLTDLPWTAEELPLPAMTIVSPHLMVMPAGRSAWAATTNSASPEALVSSLSSMTEFVIVSAAPVHQTPDALAWARATDGAVLVVRRDATRAELLRGAVKSLRQVGARVIGVIMDEPRRRRPWSGAARPSGGRSVMRNGSATEEPSRVGRTELVSGRSQ